jgi:hypothetical protein
MADRHEGFKRQLNLEIDDLNKIRAKAKEISRRFSDKIAEIGLTNQGENLVYREEVSHLTALVWDVFESFNTIYNHLIPTFELTSATDAETLGNLLMDIKSEFQHIAQHISEADESWLQLANFCYASADKRINKVH